MDPSAHPRDVLDWVGAHPDRSTRYRQLEGRRLAFCHGFGLLSMKYEPQVALPLVHFRAREPRERTVLWFGVADMVGEPHPQCENADRHAKWNWHASCLCGFHGNRKTGSRTQPDDCWLLAGTRNHTGRNEELEL